MVERNSRKKVDFMDVMELLNPSALQPSFYYAR